jgi:hypothetical protein
MQIAVDDIARKPRQPTATSDQAHALRRSDAISPSGW